MVWQSPVPGRGHGSPTIVGQHIFLATADEDKGSQSVLCYDRANGKQLWQTEVFASGLMKKGNRRSSQASATVACDGERLFVNFLNSGAVYTTALSRKGTQLWQTKITDYVVHQGFGSSPAIYGPLVVASADNKGGGALVGMNRETGEIVWQHKRPKTANYASPIILPIAGRDQLLLMGCNRVSSFDPLTGNSIWEIDGATTECVSSMVTDGQRIFISGGYPKKHVAALRADGSGKIDWEKKDPLYVPSMLIKDGYLYVATERGEAVCWHAATGKEQWRQKLGGVFSASVVLVGKHILAINEKGRVFIFEANPQTYVPVAETQLGDEAFATPTVCNSRIFARVAHRQDGQRQETLYCIGEEPSKP
ncbi:PQQ-binding-like beta-propeller repeat protein [Planctomycetota bacterium]